MRRYSPVGHGGGPGGTRRHCQRAGPGWRAQDPAGRFPPAPRRPAGSRHRSGAWGPDHVRGSASAGVRRSFPIPQSSGPRLLRVCDRVDRRRRGHRGRRYSRGSDRLRRRGPRALACGSRRSGAPRRRRDRGGVQARGRRGACRGEDTPRQRLQGSARPQPACANPGRVERGRVSDSGPAGLARLEGRDKVTGDALYAAADPAAGVLYAMPVQATIAKGTIDRIDADPARALPGVVTVLTHESAERLAQTSDQELAVLQSSSVAYRGQVVGLVVAESLEVAREAAALVRLDYVAEPHAVELRVGDPRLYKPDHVNPNYETDTQVGDFDAAYAAASVKIDQTYRTPAEHNNPMEPHATLATWTDDHLTLYDSNQGSTAVRDVVAQAFRLRPEQVRVIARHVGGGFGQKGTPRPHVILAALAARATGRPVKLAITRQQMFAFVGYRTPTIQRLRLAADESGRLSAIAHDVVEQTSTVREFAEQTALSTRHMYAAPTRRTTHRLARLG